MATSASIHRPYESAPRSDQETPLRNDALWTAGALTTQGSIAVFSSATSSQDFYLTAISVCQTDVTAAALLEVYADTTAIMAAPTGTAGQYAMTFPPPGILCGTTTTATVSIVLSGGTATVTFVATGMRQQ